VVVARANGKINFGLEILGRRADGYHEIVTILQQIELGDRLTFRLAKSLTLTTDRPGLHGEANLVWRAAELLRTEAKVSHGAAMTLEKQIPIAAGLGGGSSDAAVTLLALNQLWELGLSLDELAPIARALGTDVSFFLAGGTQLATGRGDILSPLPTPDHWAVLGLISETVADKTKHLYGSLLPDDFTDGHRTGQIARDLSEGRRVNQQLVTSAFQRATLNRFPGVRKVFDAMSSVGASPHLCGAGPTVISLHESGPEATRVASELRMRGVDTRVVRPLAGNAWRIDR
jgi:4-diphosphocytidyl-2-C-methyl-D-erythritol kinase